MDQVKTHQEKAAAELYRVLAGSGGDNVFLSPFSISTALAMVYAGAAGDTALEMRQALALPEDATALHTGYQKVMLAMQNLANVTLSTANKLYIQKAYAILDSYSGLLKDRYSSELKMVDFGNAVGTSNLINNDVETLTKGKIKGLIEPNCLNDCVRAVLINAIYFKGSWKYKFEKEETTKRDFFAVGGSVVQTDMMYMDNKKFNCGHIDDLGCKAIELPYENKRFSMIVLLPNEKDGVDAMTNKLLNLPMQSICEKLRSRSTMIIMPKFKLETSYDMGDHLKSLGIKRLFDAHAADLSNISGSKDLFVSKVIHKAFIEVNEEGSEAAAATGMVMMMRCAMPAKEDKFEFVADHPFFFAIVDAETGLTLFSGRYASPQ